MGVFFHPLIPRTKGAQSLGTDLVLIRRFGPTVSQGHTSRVPAGRGLKPLRFGLSPPVIRKDFTPASVRRHFPPWIAVRNRGLTLGPDLHDRGSAQSSPGASPRTSPTPPKTRDKPARARHKVNLTTMCSPCAVPSTLNNYMNQNEKFLEHFL